MLPWRTRVGDRTRGTTEGVGFPPTRFSLETTSIPAASIRIPEAVVDAATNNPSPSGQVGAAHRSAMDSTLGSRLRPLEHTTFRPLLALVHASRVAATGEAAGGAADGTIPATVMVAGSWL